MKLLLTDENIVNYNPFLCLKIASLYGFENICISLINRVSSVDLIKFLYTLIERDAFECIKVILENHNGKEKYQIEFNDLKYPLLRSFRDGKIKIFKLLTNYVISRYPQHLEQFIISEFPWIDANTAKDQVMNKKLKSLLLEYIDYC